MRGETGVRVDLAALKRVAQMGSWQPQYVDLDPSQERLAEMVLKLETARFTGSSGHANWPIGTSSSASAIRSTWEVRPMLSQIHRPSAVSVAEQLRDVIQDLVNAILNSPARVQ